MQKTIFILIPLLLSSFFLKGQNSSHINGQVIAKKSQEALSYTNILVLDKQQGTISNDAGFFTLDTIGIAITDTVSFQYIGYKTRKITVEGILEKPIIELEENLINLGEAFVYGDPPNPKDIIKNIIKNKEQNYILTTSKAQVFARRKDLTDINQISTDIKKNSISEIDQRSINKAINNIPRHITSYTDFLVNIYMSDKYKDSLKIDPIRTVSLEQEDIAELENFGKIFERLFKDTSEGEYWKVKSGILSNKINIEEDEKETDLQDTTNLKNTTKTRYYNRMTRSQLKFIAMNDIKEWEFLYDTGKYKYTLIGGAKVNGEDVYIIDFTPKGGGKLEGRLFVSINTFALIKADYQYASGKMGRDFNLLGVTFAENYFKASIYFEKDNDHYQLKYFSKNDGISFSLDRNISLIKKKKRFLFDKKLTQIKVGIKMQVDSKSTTELVVLEHTAITNKIFDDFTQQKRMKIIYTDQFNDKLWEGFPIIEPTKRMREYKKQEFNFDD
ncbi:MAG: carboxypeptidase-like regulatory domain-containing protein [Bacteroidales bacterium]|nr:carboxypeptidase-like regulatory domain-containing protein [Bacteroidales bacterium]